MRTILLLAVLFLLPPPLWASYTCGSATTCTVTCDGSADNVDLASAIATISNGGTITVGTGSCQIASTVTINKPLTLSGAGAALTVFGGTASPVIRIAHGSTYFARVTGLSFTSSVEIAVQLSGPITQVRVDNTTCNGPTFCVYVSGRVEGVVDHNSFIDCDRCIMAVGTNHSAWTLDFDTTTGNFVAGSSHMLFIETNTIQRTAAFSKPGNEFHYTQEGARTVFRYNSVDMTGWTTNTGSHDIHGNQYYYDSGSTFRGQPIHEIYENTYAVHTVPTVIGLRSGSVLIFNNTITTVSSVPKVIKLVEEESFSGTGQHFSGQFDYVWPTEDMVTNTFIWNNTINGVALTSAHVGGTGYPDCCGTYSDTNYTINVNRDVWMHAPQATGGRTYYNNRPGASGRAADGTLVFTTSGPNAYYPYTPYTYPHPLTGSLSAPTQVTVRGSLDPALCWTHDGAFVSSFSVQVDGGTASNVSLPTSTTCGQQPYGMTLPTLATGAHTIVVSACDLLTNCVTGTTLYVVKL